MMVVMESDDASMLSGRQWTYQTCSEFGYYQTSDFQKQPFGHHFPLEFFIKQCQDIYDPKFNAELILHGINRTNTNYGGYGIKVTNVVFPNGSIDPWHALGIVKDLSPDATAIFIQGMESFNSLLHGHIHLHIQHFVVNISMKWICCFMHICVCGVFVCVCVCVCTFPFD